MNLLRLVIKMKKELINVLHRDITGTGMRPYIANYVRRGNRAILNRKLQTRARIFRPAEVSSSIRTKEINPLNDDSDSEIKETPPVVTSPTVNVRDYCFKSTFFVAP
ncbi:hypothetical protein CDAR_428701 [Caerostris darwini]|uniref:Uncharacterized protein n=1 Tax=Caerostris darwini TaxID=1538125 RepID=A0AAV4TSN9_9ARAC|nr:hypothetical protein CDAR_428701 [Caerostris darwini]